VEDNGPGFEPTDSDSPGIALENIRQRMKMMCGGRISVTPREGGGTVVTLTVPGKAKELMSQ
jgi:signal transduction histidine kinase